jgi:predicted RNase H-like HicB family nuclease
MAYNFKIKYDREEDGRWIAEVPSLPGVMVYGATKAEAARAVRVLAHRVLGD